MDIDDQWSTDYQMVNDGFDLWFMNTLLGSLMVNLLQWRLIPRSMSARRQVWWQKSVGIRRAAGEAEPSHPFPQWHWAGQKPSGHGDGCGNRWVTRPQLVGGSELLPPGADALLLPRSRWDLRGDPPGDTTTSGILGWWPWVTPSAMEKLTSNGGCFDDLWFTLSHRVLVSACLSAVEDSVL